MLCNSCSHLFELVDSKYSPLLPSARTLLPPKRPRLWLHGEKPWVLTLEEWNDIIRSAWRRNPFTIVPVDQNMVVVCSTSFHLFSRRQFRVKKKAMNIQHAMVLDYSSYHVTEVWVKYEVRGRTLEQVWRGEATHSHRIFANHLKVTFTAPCETNL